MGVNGIAISVTSRRLVRGMKVDHKKRRGEGFKSKWMGGEELRIEFGRTQASEHRQA